jgi:hypothetical protein
MMSSYSNESEHVLLANLIDNAIKDASKQTIDVNPVSRLRDHHKRVNKYLENLHALGIQGVELNDSVKLKLPSFVHETEAGFDVKSVKGLELEVRK